MFEESEVKQEVVNLPNQRLLHFGESIFNLDDVSEILRFTKDTNKIVFVFKNGREREFSYDTLSCHSFALKRLDHCIQRNLLLLKLTSDCHAKWEGYRLDAINKAALQATA
jgi:hypothetical protein